MTKKEREAFAEALWSVHSAMTGTSRDQSMSRYDAWIYGIVVGWREALPEVAARHGWEPELVDRLKRLREAFRVGRMSLTRGKGARRSDA